jgi:hypothetical protein
VDEIILPAMRSHVPELPKGDPKPTWHLPIHIYTKDGIDLDFGPLLLFDRAAIDSYSLEYVKTSRRPELKPLANSITELIGEGYLVDRDFGSELSEVRSAISTQVENIIKDPLLLRQPYLKGIDGYRSNLDALKSVHVDYDPSLMTIGFGLHIYLMKHYGRIDELEKKRLDDLMMSTKKRWKKQEVDDIREVIRPTITYLYQNMALSEIYGTPFIDASYTYDLYNILYKDSLKAFDQNSKDTAAQIQEAQRLFNCVLPQLRPASPKKMVALLKQKSIKDFREFVSEAAKNGMHIERDEYNSLLIEVIKTHHKLASIRSAIAWGERTISLIPVPGLSHLAAGAGFLLEKYVHRKMAKKHEWLYALVNSADPPLSNRR